MPDIVPGPQAYFRGASDLPGAKINMGWQIFTKPLKLEMESHHHDTDEYLIFLGSTFPDLVGAFDAEIELFMGKEYEGVHRTTFLIDPEGKIKQVFEKVKPAEHSQEILEAFEKDAP